MSIYLPSIGGKEPYWGPQTSHMNFCEEDYHLTSYIGEFINTLTSLFYAYLGYRGIVGVRARDERSFLPTLTYHALIVLGICSALFHGTLKYPMQLLDDNSMLFGTGVMLHRLLAPTLGASPSQTVALAIILFVTICGAIWAHIVLGESTLHQVVFGSMMLTNATLTSRIIRLTVKDEVERKRLKMSGLVALGLFLFGYALWNIENQFCGPLRNVRKTVGLPWAWLFELHGWWHILTGLGVYLHTIMVERLCPTGTTIALPMEERVPKIAFLEYGNDTEGEVSKAKSIKKGKGGKRE